MVVHSQPLGSGPKCQRYEQNHNERASAGNYAPREKILTVQDVEDRQETSMRHHRTVLVGQQTSQNGSKALLPTPSLTSLLHGTEGGRKTRLCGI